MRDLIVVVLLALAWSASSWAQDDAEVAACLVKSQAVKADSPLKAVQAQKDVYDACVASAISDPQRRTLALFKSAQVMCDVEVKNRLKKDPLIPPYEQSGIFRDCMARPPGNYAVQ